MWLVQNIKETWLHAMFRQWLHYDVMLISFEQIWMSQGGFQKFWKGSFTAQFILFDIRDIKRGKWERQIAGNGKLNIYLKNHFDLLVMNVTQLNFLDWQNVHLWHFIKVNYKRSLLFVVVPTLITWSKAKIFTDYDDKT